MQMRPDGNAGSIKAIARVGRWAPAGNAPISTGAYIDVGGTADEARTAEKLSQGDECKLSQGDECNWNTGQKPD